MGKKTFEKKKQREKEVKKKLAVRRAITQLKAKEEREKEKQERAIQRAANRLEGRTIKNKKETDVIDQLSHNLEILEALQQEQERLQEAQKNAPMINMAGVPMMPPPPEGGKLTASADVVFIPNPDPSQEVKDE